MAREVRVAILGDSRDFSRAVRDARNDAGRLDGAFGRIGRGAVRMGQAVALGLGGLAVGAGAAAVSFIRAAEESQQVSRQTEAVLRSMGATSWQTAEGVAALSERLSLQTGIDDELIQSGQNVLLTFAQVQNRVGEGNDVFDRATRAALDMSVALGTDMSQASMQVGRALNDPVRGLAALRRSGIQFTAQQEEQIRTMTEVGDVAGAQRVMLEELERQFGGSAEAQATASGRLATAWGNIQEQLGEKLIPVFTQVADWLIQHLPGAMATAEEWLARFSDGVGVVVEFVQENWPKIQATIQAFTDWAVPKIQQFIGFVEGAWATFGDELLTVARGIWTAIRGVVEGTINVIRGIINVVMAIIHGDFSQAWEGIKQIVVGVWTAISGAVSGYIEIVKGVISAGLAVVSGLFANVWAGIVSGAEAVWTRIVAVWDAIVAFITGIPGRIADAARGLWDGIVNAVRAGVDAIIGQIDRMLGPIDEALDRLRTLSRLGSSGGGGGFNFGWESLGLPGFAHGGTVPGPVGAPTLAVVHGGERVLTPAQQMGGGGNTYVLNVNATPGTNKAELGRELIELIKAYENGNGPRWRS